MAHAVRRAGWLAALAVLAVAAYLVARTGSALFEAWLVTSAPMPVAARDWGARGEAPEPPADKSDDVVLARNLFDSTGPAAAAAGEATSAEAPFGEPGWCAAPAEKSKVELVGIATASVHGYGLAALRVDGALRFGRVDDAIGAYVITELHAHWLCLAHGDALEYADVFDPPAKAKSARTGAKTKPIVAAGATRNDLDHRIKRVGPDQYEVDATLVSELLRDPRRASRMGRAVPHLEGGRFAGLKLYALRPNETLYRLGARNGDIVRSVDGEVITSLDRALAMVGRLLDATEVTVGLERRGAPVTIHVSTR